MLSLTFQTLVQAAQPPDHGRNLHLVLTPLLVQLLLQTPRKIPLQLHLSRLHRRIQMISERFRLYPKLPPQLFLRIFRQQQTLHKSQ